MFYRFAKFIVSIILNFLYKIEVQGLDNIPKQGGCIIFANHISNFDSLVIAINIKRQVFFMAKKELYRNPIMAFILNHLGAFPVKRGKGDISAIKKSLKILKEGKLLGIFPEGTRSKDNKLKKLQSGIALIALKSNSPLVPVYLKANYKLHTKIIIKIGKPIYPDNYKQYDLNQITDYIYDQLSKLGEQLV